MKTIDKIIMYLDGQMSPDEKSLFEEKIDASSEIRKELEKYKSLMKEIQNLDDVQLNEDYISQVVPKFRERLSKQKKHRFSPKYALGLSTITAVLLIFIFIINKPAGKKDITLTALTEQLTHEDLSSAIKLYDNQTNIENFPQFESAGYDSVLNSLIIGELNGSSESANYILSYANSDMNNMLQSINEVEADKIYKELLNKRIY